MRIKAEHADDSQAILNDRVKGQLKVTRAFGAGFLKKVCQDCQHLIYLFIYFQLLILDNCYDCIIFLLWLDIDLKILTKFRLEFIST